MLIRNKLILYTFISIVLTLIIVGFFIDRIITNLYNDNALNELNISYAHFQKVSREIEYDILSQTLQVASDKPIIAALNLVNRYQDIKNYQPLIFDNEKKSAAESLYKNISLSGSERAMIYGKDGSLVAYAILNSHENEVGIVSYVNGKPFYLIKKEASNIWNKAKLPESITFKQPALNKQISFLSYPGKIKYTAIQDEFIIENNRVITREHPNGSVSLIGIVKISKSLGADFFRNTLHSSHAQISLLLNNGYLINSIENLLPINDLQLKSNLHGSTSPPSNNIIENEDYYIQSYSWPTITGINYLLITSERSQLILALNKTRKVLLLAFSATAILSIFIGIFWLGRVISTPLNNLAKQAGSIKDNEYPVFPVNNSGDEISLLGNVLNKMIAITKEREKDLKQNEAQLQSTQKLAKIGGWEIDYKSNLIQLSEEAFNIFEINKRDGEVSQRIITEKTHPDDLDKINQAHQKTIDLQIPYDVTHRLKMKDGRIKTVHVYSETIFNSNGKPQSTLGTIQDISEQASKDEQLRRTQKMNSLGKLTGGIAHDFNNMLSIILGYSELLEKNPNIDDKEKKYIIEIIHAGQRASKLTSKLLSFSRKESIAATETNLNNLLQDELDMLEKTLTVRIQLKLELDDKLWTILLDKDELEDAILNICINSMHAMPSGGNLTLATNNSYLNDIDAKHLNVTAGEYVVLTIKDTGIGMDQSTLYQIFEPFFTTKKEKGTGLGMSQVYGFVQRSKGAINIYSEPNHGTRITLYFPRYTGNQSVILNGEKNHETIVNEEHGTATILVVDDEESLRNLSQEILTSKGYKVITADSGKQALEILKKEHVGLLLSDVIMPEMDGYKLATIVQEKYPSVKIQMISGFTDEESMEASSNELHQKRIQKPFTSKDLLLRVKEILLVT